MLWVYGHYKYFNSFRAGIDFKRQDLTFADVRFWRIKTVPALRGLMLNTRLRLRADSSPLSTSCVCWVFSRFVRPSVRPYKFVQKLQIFFFIGRRGSTFIIWLSVYRSKVLGGKGCFIHSFKAGILDVSFSLKYMSRHDSLSKHCGCPRMRIMVNFHMSQVRRDVNIMVHRS